MANIDKLTFVLDAKMTGLEQTLSRADKQIRSFADNADKSNQLAASSFNLLKNAALGFLTVSSAKEVIQIADSYQLLQSRIRTATDSMQSFNYASAELFSISQNTATALETNVALFQRLKIGATELGRTDSDVLRLVEAINKLGVIGGASQTEISNASIQLSQALAGGIVRAEEFNSIVENTPLLAQAIAEGLNVSVGELRQMVLDGRLLADDVFESVLGQTNKIDKKFEELGSNLGRSIQRATGAMQLFIGKTDEAYGYTKLLATWMDAWSKKAQIVAEQISRANTYDQAEKVNEVREQYDKLNSELERNRDLLDSAPARTRGLTVLRAQVAEDEKRLNLLKKQLEAENKKLELLTNQEILTEGAGKRLGIDMPPDAPKPPDKPLIDRIDLGRGLSGGAGGSRGGAAGSGGSKPPNRKRGLLEGFQDFAADQNASAFFGLAGDLENYRESQMSALDIETEMHEKRMKVLEEFATRNTELAAYTNSVIETEQDRHAKSMAAIDQARFAAQVSIAQQGLGNLATLMNSQSRKAFETGKIAAIAMATINGIQSVVASYKWGSELGGPILGAAFAATAAAATAVQIQQLKSQQFGGGGTVAGSSNASPGTYVPPQPTQPYGASNPDDKSGRNVNLIFNGDVNGFDIPGLAEQLGEFINQSDTIFIDGNSRTGLQFATAY